ncbi:MAG: NUDIX domain-containing protein [Pseudomonadota bacterium]|nr:NUDIX domain-containing protein [Pseudomonadota bacterium]
MADAAIPAATLIVVRERPAGAPELLMVERPEGMAFAGGALVFPGGRVDDADTEFARSLGLGDNGADRIAAMRETLEETGIAVGLDPLPSPAIALELQKALLDGGGFASTIGSRGFRLDAGALTAFARWVPKFHATRRFDTLFFIAAAPAGVWQPHAAPGECAAAFWVSAQEVLERDRAGTARLIFPTRRNLERLAEHDTIAGMMEDAAAHPVEPITPWVEELEGERFITIPANLGYPVVREKFDGLWRG